MKFKNVIIVILILIVCSLSGCIYALYGSLNDKNEKIDQLERKISKLNSTQNSNSEEKTSHESKVNEKKEENNSKASSTNTKKVDKQEEKVYELGETWTVDGQWSLTITSVTTTDERNQFSDKTPAQVVYITYSYENLGYEDGYTDGLYMSSMDMTVVDANGEIADTYPNSTETSPQRVPVGVKCANAQECVALNNTSDYITLIYSDYDGNGKKQSAKFHLKVD